MNFQKLRQNPLLRWLMQPRRIPLLFAVTVVAGMFYHYAPSLTWLWVLLSLVMQSLLFKLFDFVKRHHFLGGLLYLAAGSIMLAAAMWLIQEGYWGRFAPDDLNYRLRFFVWFLTPQSVLATSYPAYNFALFLLFTFFIGTIAYYFTFVRYRVLMSFLVMLFPFAIYAKENETMPVPSIIILLVSYFAVMVYCRQAHAEDSEMVQRYEPGAVSTLTMPGKKSAFAGRRPEMLDGHFLRSAGMFLAAASIFILILPKPTVEADRTVMDTMLDRSAFSDYLMDAIRGFAESSDGGGYSSPAISRTLFRTTGTEPLNLRLRTFTNYDYSADEWSAGFYDAYPSPRETTFMELDNWRNTLSCDLDPVSMARVLRDVAGRDPEFAAHWGIDCLRIETPLPEYRTMTVEPATNWNYVYIAPTGTVYLSAEDLRPERLFRSRTGILFRETVLPLRRSYTVHYLSSKAAQEEVFQSLMHSRAAEHWSTFVWQLQSNFGSDPKLAAGIQRIYDSLIEVMSYDLTIENEPSAAVCALAEQLTDGLTSDYDKMCAIRDYLTGGEFTYSLNYPITDADNVETFLFRNKTGVCYQFATAMTELCRAAGLTARYVEGYSMQEPDRRLGSSRDGFIITTEHAHAFTEVYVHGYGWLMADATASDDSADGTSKPNVILSLQYSGLLLFAAALLVICLLYWLVPLLRERWFRRWYAKNNDAHAVQAAFGRLRRQWEADPARTAADLCAEQAAFLGQELSELLRIFEETLYAGRCTTETAAKFFQLYCAAYDARRPAQRRARQEARAARKAAKHPTEA